MKPSRKHPKNKNSPRILELKASVNGSTTKNALIEKVSGWQCVCTRPPKQLLQGRAFDLGVLKLETF